MKPLQTVEFAPGSSRSSAREWADVVADFAIFAGLGRRSLRRLAEEARFVEFAPGDEVVVQGRPADSLFVIVSGHAKARGKRGSRLLGPGDFFGEMALVGGERSATVVAAGELHVMVLPQRALRRMIDRHPSVGLAILTEVAARLHRLEHAA